MAPPNPTPPPSDSAASNSDSSNTSSSSSSIAAAASSSKMLNCLCIPKLKCKFKFKFSPVIGILSHPGDGNSGKFNNAPSASYIAASYVKFVESAGARVIPLIYNEPSELRNEKLNLVNGVIFTGGRSKKTSYFDVVESIFEYVLRKNNAGNHFPLLAICLGFELLAMVVSENKNILEKFDAKNQASTLKFTKNVNLNGTLFQRFPPDLFEKLSTKCLAMQNHSYGISPEKFRKTKSLRRFFKILTTSTDKKNKDYVSTVQAHKYPVTAVQWHPEKIAFDSGLSVQVSKHVASFLVREARMSKNRPSSRKVQANLIHNSWKRWEGGLHFQLSFPAIRTRCRYISSTNKK